MNPPTNNWK